MFLQAQQIRPAKDPQFDADAAAGLSFSYRREPNEAISEGDDIYVIDPKLCTECVGFHDHEACQAVCPVECCLPDPKNVETEDVLLARARSLHPDKTFPQVGDLPVNLSRFRK